MVCAMIVDNIVGMDSYRADLRTKVSLHMLAFESGCLLFALLLLPLIEASLEQLHRDLAVLNLRAFILAGHDNARRDMAHAHRRVGLVDVLSARARRTIGIDFNIFGANGNLDSVLDVGHDLDLGKRGMAAMRGIKG